MPDTLIHRYVASARAGTNPAVIARVRSGWVVAGEREVVRGYCVLLPDPVVPDLNALEGSARLTFLEDMARLGDVLLEVTGAARINYEILGNAEPALHAHVIPRYESEPEDLRKRPIWFYDWSKAPSFDRASQGAVMDMIRAGLKGSVHHGT